MPRSLDLGRTSGGVSVTCAMANAVAAAAAWTWIRPGAAWGGAFDSRFHYLAQSGGRWTAAWVATALASLTILIFSILLAFTLDPGRRRLAWWAVGIGAFGLVTGLADVVLSLLTPPRLARTFLRADLGAVDLQGLEIYLARVDRISAVVGGFVAGVFGSVSGLLLNAIAFQTRGFPRWLAWAGLPVWGLSTGLAFCSLGGYAAGIGLLTPAFRLSMAFWAFAVGAAYHWGPAFRAPPRAMGSPPPPDPTRT